MRRIAVLGLVFVAAILSCSKDVTGPLGSAARYVRGLSWDAVFPPAFQAAGGSSSGLVQFNRVHVVLHHSDGTVALDTTIDFPPGDDSLTVNLTVKLLDNAPASGEPMTLTLDYLNAAGDIVFKGGPVSVTASPPPAGGGSNPPVHVPVSYTGPGANAVAVAISPRSGTVVAGAGFSFTAIAKDVNGVTLAGTPIIWNSLDPAIATITSAAAGTGLAQNQRGTARIIAQLLTGPADTVHLFVLLPASQIIAQSGDAQTGVVGTQLAQPLVVKVAATDGIGVAGTTVNFAVATGGGSVGNASVVSDANGLAQTTFRLGTGTGAQSVTATAGTLTNSPLTFTATAQAATATKLVITTQPVNSVAGTALTPVVFTAEDNNGNIATTFTGPVTVSFGANSAAATLGGTTTVIAVAGVATFSTLAVNKNGTAYTLVASSTGLTSATTNAFDVVMGAPNKLVITAQPADGNARVAMGSAIVVNAQDSQGNPTASFTGAVALGLATNPTGATLGGTLTVNAVAGVATFTGISVSLAGSGYAFSASATGLTSATSNLFDIGGGIATTMAVAGGAAQTGLPSALLAQPVVIKVTDAGGTAIAGTTVNFAVVTGGGSVAPASGVTNASGLVQTAWTLGAFIGAQTVRATSAGLAGSPLTISATATVATANKTWTGATNNLWATATNWSPAGVPAATDSVLIPVTANNPTLAATATVADLYIASGATLTLTSGAVTLGVNGALDATGGILGTGNVALTPPVSRSIKGSITAGTTTLFGPYTQNGSFIVVGNLVNNSGGSLVMNGNTTAVTGNFSTAGSGKLTMNNAADALTVTGNVTFGGGNETGLLTAGNLFVTGNFAQASGSTSFIAAAAHTTTLNGTVAQTVNFANPFPSTFGAVVFANTAGVTLQTNMISNGAVTVSAGAVSGTAIGFTIGGTLTDPSALLAVPSISFTGSTTPVAATTPTINSSVTFNNNPSILAGNLTVNGTVNVDGNLQLNGHHLSVSGSFFTVAAGQLTMTNSTDSLNIGGNATFGGGVEAGSLTAGKMVLNGNFTQSNNGNGQEFKAVAGHLTVLTGSAAQTISFANPDTTLDTTCSNSCFGDLTINKSGGTVVYVTAADHRGTLTVMPGVTSVTATTSIVTVHGSTVTPASTAVHFASLGTFGSLAVDPVTLVDTIAFDGTAAQVIPAGTYNRTYIKGTPTVAAGGFSTNFDLAVDGGVLTLGGNAVSVLGNFVTSGTGILVMNNALDSLFVVGQATFAGGAEAGSLTNGVLALFQGIAVSAQGQFNASGSHVTYMVGPHLVCESCGVLARGRQSVLAGALVHGAPSTIAARRAEAAAAATGARAEAAARLAARETLAAKWPSRADAARAAAAAGTAVSGIRSPAPMRTSSPRASATVGRPNVRFDVAPGARLGGRTLAASIAVHSYSASAVLVAFADTTGNQFANVRVVGSAQWQTYARAAGNVLVDTTGAIEGSGHLAIAGNLVASYNSTVEPEAVELFGVLSDTGYFSPDTTLFSGASQTMPSRVGGSSPYYNNVVVNSPALSVLAEDGNEIDIWGSLFIQNSGQLRIGAPDSTCTGCNSDYIYLYGALETHGSGTLRMNDANQPWVAVSGNALFAGGSSTGLLTQGEIDFYANLTQSGPSTTSYAATATHESYFGASSTAPTVTFATPGYASSHFGTLYFSDTSTVLMSDVFADGQLQTGGASSFRISSALDHLVTSRGANLRNVVFDNVRWETTDVGSGSGTFPSIDSVTFQNIVNTTAPQFDFEYPATTNLTLAGFSFLTTPTGAGSYIKIVGPDTLTMTSVTPAFNGGFLSLSGLGAVIDWPAGPATHLAFSVSPSTTVAGASITPAIVVQARDAGNALSTSFTGNVTLAIGTNPDTSTLSGTVTVAAVAGVATFNDISLNKVGTGYTLTAADTGLAGVTSSAFNVTAGPLATITVTPNPTTLLISATQQFTAIGKDANGNVVAITPIWSVVASGGTISSTGLFTAGTTLGTFINTVTATSGAISGTATVIVIP